MRLSFDLDDTLIRYQEGIPREKCLLGWTREPLRQGAVSLWRELARRGYRIGIYTTSYRDPWKVRFWLLCYRLWPAFVLTQRDNDIRKIANKDPRAFGIDCHIDDDETGADIHVLPSDANWVETVLARLSG